MVRPSSSSSSGKWSLYRLIVLLSLYVLTGPTLSSLHELQLSSPTKSPSSVEITLDEKPTTSNKGVVPFPNQQNESRPPIPICMVHNPRNITAVRVSNPNITVLQQNSTMCGTLRHDWTYHPPLSRYANMIQRHQSNCTIPLATHNVDNNFGIGSHLTLWGQSMCKAMHRGYRMHSYQPHWLWLDQEYCDATQAQRSPFLCYFPSSEFLCDHNKHHPSSTLPSSRPVVPETEWTAIHNLTNPRDRKTQCQLLKTSDKRQIQEWRAASTEYLFQRVSPIIIQEAQRQAGLLFEGGIAPPDLITVHIRWGDKFGGGEVT